MYHRSNTSPCIPINKHVKMLPTILTSPVNLSYGLRNEMYAIFVQHAACIKRSNIPLFLPKYHMKHPTNRAHLSPTFSCVLVNRVAPYDVVILFKHITGKSNTISGFLVSISLRNIQKLNNSFIKDLGQMCGSSAF